ncbi:MAG: hypothetical protein U5J64_00580 [Halobacteriales archaeon]|nr:hypothetical protein [Halobacteriales archaeon]
MPVLGSMFDAVVKTRLFLLPFELRRYAVVALVTTFVGVRAGYGSVTNLGAVFLFDGDLNTTEPPVAVLAETVGGFDLLVVGGFAVVLAVFISAVAEFVLIDVLRTDETDVGRYARDRVGDGARLFVFRSVATVVVFVPAVVLSTLVESAPDSVVTTAVVSVLVSGVVVSLVNGFTTDFVAPVMVVRDCSLLEGWRAFSRVLVRQPIAFVGYAVARSVVNLAVAVGATVAAVAVAAFYALPLAGLSLAMGLTTEGQGLSPEVLVTTVAGFVLLVVVLVVYVALVAASVAVLVQLPVRLFFRSWSLYFLGEVEETYETLEKPD